MITAMCGASFFLGYRYVAGYFLIYMRWKSFDFCVACFGEATPWSQDSGILWYSHIDLFCVGTGSRHMSTKKQRNGKGSRNGVRPDFMIAVFRIYWFSMHINPEQSTCICTRDTRVLWLSLSYFLSSFQHKHRKSRTHSTDKRAETRRRK